jgi:hypothetical protein
MASFLASAIITDIRATTQKTIGPLPDADLLPWINASYQVLRRKLADLIPDFYTRVTADFTIASPASSQDLAAAPLSLTDVGKLRTVERKEGADYYPMQMVGVAWGSRAHRLSWRQRGETTIEVVPAELAPGTYRVKYLEKPIVIDGTGDTLVLPDGGDAIVVEEASARVRVAFEEDPSPHQRLAKSAWDELSQSLMRMYPSAPIQIRNVYGGRW